MAISIYLKYKEESCYVSESVITVKIKWEQQKLCLVAHMTQRIGDFNPRIIKEVIPGVKWSFNEEIINDNEVLMNRFCSYNEHNLQPQRTHKSTICYIVIKRKFHPTEILDFMLLNSVNVCKN